MKFKINNFIVKITKRKETLKQMMTEPLKLSYNKSKIEEYKLVNRTREFTVFDNLILLEKNDNTYYQVINDVFDFIDMIEILKAYNSKKLDSDKEYKINNKFTAKVVQKNQKTSLKLHFKDYSYSLYLDKFDCSSLAAKFSKILQKCEV